MKKRQRKVIISILIILSLIIFLFQIRKKTREIFQDELIFFKLFSSGKEKKQELLQSKNQTNLSYEFKVSYKNVDFKEINLTDTINPNTLIREKIAPGTEGKFEIILQSNQKINYRIKFKSENEKPENLNFRIEVMENKRNTIHWEWEYQKDNTQDRQDTKDGERIKQYHFIIYAIGE